MLKKAFKDIFSNFGFSIISEYSFKRQALYIELLEEMINSSFRYQLEGCTIIVFSKDRAMQLEALLSSYFHYVKYPPKVLVLYNCSNSSYESSYLKLASNFRNQKIEFFKENKFKEDLTRIMNRVETSKIMFLVDDIIFKNTVDFRKIALINPKEYVFSLRMGSHLKFSYTLQKEQKKPEFTQDKKHPDMLSWKYINEEFDWAYPLSVDGHLFSTSELKVLVKQLDYKAPNSFEEAIQIMYPLFSNRSGLCYNNSAIVNNPCNKVQLENNNISGSISAHDLNNKWQEGYRIDYKNYEGIKNKSAHEELPISFVKR